MPLLVRSSSRKETTNQQQQEAVDVHRLIPRTDTSRSGDLRRRNLKRVPHQSCHNGNGTEMPLTTTAPVQSPISLCQRSTAFKDGVQPLEFFGHWDGRGKAKIVNNGASAMRDIRYEEES
ncbi:hypothetical protein quinque_015637 [Culex quinquefasciatus]